MVNVNFNDERSTIENTQYRDTRPLMVRWVMKAGFAKTAEGANAVLIGTALIFFGLAVFITLNALS